MRERFAAIIGLLAFLSQVLLGLLARQHPAQVLTRALVFLICATAVAWVVASLGARIVGEHINRHPPDEAEEVNQPDSEDEPTAEVAPAPTPEEPAEAESRA